MCGSPPILGTIVTSFGHSVQQLADEVIEQDHEVLVLLEQR